eukprot:TRINITY_DN11116_c1_g1_i2.p1 TRINITY_DN11116_c1_g1~~TRINITY_DN11116_c1_g1_i2.p1  ORF type:complete len:523 (+),score=167.96 TRINITY_DN11116_c1_g1_i2:104-1672(+)
MSKRRSSIAARKKLREWSEIRDDDDDDVSLNEEDMDMSVDDEDGNSSHSSLSHSGRKSKYQKRKAISGRKGIKKRKKMEDHEEEEDSFSDDDHDSEKAEKKKKKKKNAKARKISLTPSRKTKKEEKTTPSKPISKGLGLRKTKETESSEEMKRHTVSIESLPVDVLTAKEMTNEDVCGSIISIVIKMVQQVLRGEGLKIDVFSRARSNQLYIPELDRIVLKSVASVRELDSMASAKKLAISIRVLQLIHEICGKGIHVTKRDLFYTDAKLFENQKNSDEILDDIACMIGCTRSSLNVVASEKGVVVGRIRFRDAGDLIDCTKMGVGGKAIPSVVEKITDIETDAEFILLVEKDATFQRLAEDRFYNRHPCVIITAKGQPDVATRLFLHKVKEITGLPILGLFDSDPYGLKILSVYMSGSFNMSYDSFNLTTSDIRWLGVRPSDLDRYRIPAQCRLKMTDADMATGRLLLKQEFVQKNPLWMKELEIMIAKKEKAEIQALAAFGFQFLTTEYLPRKLREKDYI